MDLKKGERGHEGNTICCNIIKHLPHPTAGSEYGRAICLTRNGDCTTGNGTIEDNR
jgi:hypothetical protein